MQTAIHHPHTNNQRLAAELDANPRFTRKEAAAYLGLADKTLANWASTGRYGLKYHRCGKKAIYMKADLDAWLAEQSGTQAA
ncbi:helix-turn-helix domain-containing protein [Oceanimonas baumannii]|uniref:DNA-binding protein n=1 Tax=Oceanimonas baumannii TaxID=129578 RepID=A0A235CLZ4_9GAMM|nr:helix-turn-helix domain-containing protein [Oceanimonas baumannii]OYD25572.1 DNA-binding protein [Oceanimonas baumannii]TDW61218.1 excisionase family DNA binding protein [Oceanimonas baumannii]